MDTIKCLFYIDLLTLYDTEEAPYALDFNDIFVFILGLTPLIICEVSAFEQKIDLGRKYQFCLRQKPYRPLFTDTLGKFQLVFCQNNNLLPISTACLPRCLHKSRTFFIKKRFYKKICKTTVYLCLVALMILISLILKL